MRRPSPVATGPTPAVRLLAILAASLLVIAGCSSTDESRSKPDRSASSTTSTAPAQGAPTAPGALQRSGDGYLVPSPLAPGAPGAVIAMTDPRVDASFGGASRREVLYHSSDRLGADAAVSGTVMVPSGPAPADGWPILSWGHGTTGVADRCAPSTTPNFFYNEYAQQIRGFLAAGYAVVASDYIGLGTPGLHSYSVGVDLGNAIADIVPAARSLDPSLGRNWFAVGHSEVGQGVLFATRAAVRHPELQLGGTVAIAPSSHLALALPAIAAGALPADIVYGMYFLAGLSTVDPSVKVGDLLGPAVTDDLPLVLESGCLLDGLARFRERDVASLFSIPEAEMTRLSNLLSEVGDPDRVPTVGPLLVVQGETDRDVPAGVTAGMVTRLREEGVDVTDRVYPGLDHDLVLGPSLCESLSWLHDHGGPEPTSCVAEPTDMS